jgi:serine phosphatase RsbU (regulator of sigma subunit)
MRLSFGTATAAEPLRRPQRAQFPELPGVEAAALYRSARVGGDFFDFLAPHRSKLLFILMDIAGKRETAMNLAAEAQECFREQGTRLFQARDAQDSSAVTTLILELNRRIMRAVESVVCAPAFLGCYDDEIGTLSFINAGHPSGVLRDEDGTTLLPSNGLPLGLFSHATHEAQFTVLRPGAAVVLASKGLVEVRAGGEEFGIARVQQSVQKASADSAQGICQALLNAAQRHEEKSFWFAPGRFVPGFSREPNDWTALALLRKR